jgi:UDP-N-acetylmuramyl pentapeptide phosphotransferase/UDP-N-acetylglucosamine-1-phosphate transferase
LILALLLAVGVSIGSGCIARWLNHSGLFDQPNTRSSHVVPTPRGGGLVVVPLLMFAWLSFVLWQGESPAGFWVVLISTLFLAVVAWVDDVRRLTPGPRLVAQFVAVLLGLSTMPEASLVFQGILPIWLDLCLSALIWLWFINLFNFMDGIDGLAGVECLSLGLGLGLLAAVAGWGFVATALPALAAGAAAGFLRWNWAPAQLFLGDVGSVPLGYLLGWLLLLAAGHGAWAAALIMPAYYLADATLTLLRRVLRGERVWQAHRQHFYQRAARGPLGHGGVSARVAAINTLLIGLALLSWLWQPWVPLAIATMATGGLLFYFSRFPIAEK